MITLKQLKWSNCFSYGADNELFLNDSTLTQIIGTNGVGKSSIPLIIEEALFNKNSKGIKKADIPNRHTDSGYSISLSFSKDSSEYEIIINRKTNIKINLIKDGEDISSHTATNTYKTIQEILGLDFKTFSQLVYQHPNSSLQFLTATDTNRKKFLIDLLHLEKYVNLFEIFKAASRDSVTKLTEVDAKIKTIEKWLNDNKLEDTTILPTLKIEIDTEDDEKELQTLIVELENISEKNKKINKNNQYKKMLAEINISETHTIKAKGMLSYDHLQEEAGSLQADINSSEKLLTKLSQLGDHCPTCEQDIDKEFKETLISAEQEKIANATTRLTDDIQREIRSIKQNNLDFQNKVRIEEEWANLYKSIQKDLPDSPLDHEELSSRILGVRVRIQDAKERISKISSENESRTRRNTRIQVILEQTDNFTSELNECKETLDEVKEINTHLEILKKAFSTNGLLAYKIENLVKELEELVNTYLAELSDGRFTLEFVVSNDKLNVVITDGGHTVDILALSSGELARVNTATLIAIRKLMSSISKSRLNILFLDEVINVLDEAGREKLVEVLLQEEELNTYIVSHGWTHPLLEKIEIVKNGNISELER